MDPSSSSSNSEDTGKLFIGGIDDKISDAAVTAYFKNFGEVKYVNLKKVKTIGRSRGFGFVRFSDPNSAAEVLKKEEHVIDGKKVEVKKAIPKDEQNQNQNHQYAKPQCYPISQYEKGESSSSGNPTKSSTKKIFVGGLPPHTKVDELRSYFEKIGRVTDACIMSDKVTKRPRGFGFITFESEDDADRAVRTRYHRIREEDGKDVEAKPAVPKEANSQSNLSCSSDQNSNNGNNYDPRVGWRYNNYQNGYYNLYPNSDYYNAYLQPVPEHQYYNPGQYYHPGYFFPVDIYMNDGYMVYRDPR